MRYFALAWPGLASPARRPLMLLLWLLLPLGAWAQGQAPVSGTLATPAGTAVGFATVTLHRAADSTVVKAEFSDAQGHFQFTGLVGKRYLVSAAQVGLVRHWSAPFALPGAGLVLPAMRLDVDPRTVLSELTVTARRPLFEHQADRTVVHVADNPLSAGATTLDVLGRSPGVSVDARDNLGLRGRRGLLVVIDGKRVPLTGSELADYLRALPAEQLQSIELITNPPAQYDAQGDAGVIAINLKKDHRLGTNGSANISYGRGEYGKFTAGLTLNHRRKSLNVYGSYAYTERRGFLLLDFTRQFFATPLLPAVSSVQANDQLTQLRSHSGKLGIDFTLSKRTLLGVSVTGLASESSNSNRNSTQFFGALGEPTDRYTSVANQEVNRPSGGANLNFRHTFADSAAAASLSADADFARYQTTRLLDLRTRYETPARPDAQFGGDQRGTLTIEAVKADYSRPLPHRARLEAGAKVTQIVSTNDVAFVRRDGGVSVPDPAISNHFQYRENVNAAYVSLRGAAPKTTWQAGLRLEQTNTRAELLGEESRERHYGQLFPSASVQRTLNEQHTLALNVARRLDRPSYGQISPLRVYLDATSYRAGNPDLRPQTSYNFELTHTYRQKFSTALAYAQTDQPMVNVVQPSPDGGRLVVNRDVNLTTYDYVALTLTAPLEPAKWWSLYANGVFYYSRFRGNLVGTALDRRQPACLLTANNTFSLPHGWSAELNGTYQSGEIFGFEVSRQRGQVAAGFQKSLWSKQGTLRLNVADIFYTTALRATSTYDNFSETSNIRQDSRVATVAFTYRFGSSKVTAARKRTVGAEEELRRAAGQ